ncbi:MAG: type IV pilus modification protein PilV, partial [Pseudoxanthomonas sp.]
MNRMRVGRTGPLGRRASGFSLIEVMIAVLVLGFGLLGFALLQTMSVRFAQSANQQTQATNLSYEMLDQMRANRIAAANYSGSYTATSTGCEPNSTVSPGAYKTVWQCRLQSELGAGSTATVTYVAGVATVNITWGDQRWNDA